jgi:DNA-binding transcriptional MerR regulator
LAYREKEVEKLYYSIGELSAMFQVNPSLIRFWEKEFDIINPHKNKKGNRMFTKEDVEHFRIIYNLVKERGFTLQGAKDKLKDNKEDTIGTSEVVHSLQRIRAFLLELKNGL